MLKNAVTWCSRYWCYDDDLFVSWCITSTHDHLLFLPISGRVHRLKGYEIPNMVVQLRITCSKLLKLDEGESIQTIILMSNQNVA